MPNPWPATPRVQAFRRCAQSIPTVTSVKPAFARRDQHYLAKCHHQQGRQRPCLLLVAGAQRSAPPHPAPRQCLDSVRTAREPASTATGATPVCSKHGRNARTPQGAHTSWRTRTRSSICENRTMPLLPGSKDGNTPALRVTAFIGRPLHHRRRPAPGASAPSCWHLACCRR